jgi:hypothetical protein
MVDIVAVIKNPESTLEVEACWSSLTSEFDRVAASGRMVAKRREVSFHDQVRLLGYLSITERKTQGDILEIGVWKGKSLALMSRLSCPDTTTIGIDPFALPGQAADVEIFRSEIYPKARIIQGYSEFVFSRAAQLTSGLKILHIDGGHKKENVLLDFLLYMRLVRPGGWIVFDDYDDHLHSPEVRPTIDYLNKSGYFSDFFVYGSFDPFPNSFVLRRRLG